MTPLIKSLLYSDRSMTPQNIKFEQLKEILRSEHLNEIMDKKNGELIKIIEHYKDVVNNDKTLKSSNEYLSEIKKIRNLKATKVFSGNVDNMVKERLKTIFTDKELEETKKDRGYKHFKVRNETLEIAITVKEDLMQLIELYRIDALSNIVTSYEKIPSFKLESWFEGFKQKNKLSYGQMPKKEKGRLIMGENSYKLEELHLFHCLTDDHIYLVKRTHLKF